MPKVRIEFDTESPGDSRLFLDGEDITGETHACTFSQEAQNFPIFYLATGEPREPGHTMTLYFGRQVISYGPLGVVEKP